jgi:dihydrofolate reductase
MSTPAVALIAALDEGGVIGRDGDLPWRLPSDLKRFKRLTLGHPIIMGRATYQSIGRPLPRRRNLVLSRNGYTADGIEVFPSLEAALAAVRASQAFIIGGAAVYAAGLPIADALHLSRVHARVDGDTWFPPFDPTRWQLMADEHVPADERHVFAHTYQHWTRRSAD